MRVIQNIIDLIRHKKKLVLVDTAPRPTPKPAASKKAPVKGEKISKPWVEPEHTYKHVITGIGFGHSGSGVLMDLMAECDHTTRIGYHDVRGGSPLALGQDVKMDDIPSDIKDLRKFAADHRTVPVYEFELLRRFGGLMDLERIFAGGGRSGGHLSGAVYMAMFINLIEYHYAQPSWKIYGDKFMELSYEFIDRITEFAFETRDPIAGNPSIRFATNPRSKYTNLQNPLVSRVVPGKVYKYYLKDLTLEQYYAYAREYVHKFFSSIESKDYLYVDQMFSNGTTDFDRFAQYVPGYRVVVVYRDPRDVYVEGRRNNEAWIPADKELFVKWYRDKKIENYVQMRNEHLLTVRFEDMVLDYDRMVPKVLEFYGITPEHHVAPKTQFRPEYSARNIGLYKIWEDQETIRYIGEQLSEYCYGG